MYDCLPTLGNMFGFENKFALGRDIFSLNDSEENLVIFTTGNFVTDTVYYNSQNDSYFDLWRSIFHGRSDRFYLYKKTKK